MKYLRKLLRTNTCRCGCPRGAHQHYRRGSDCGLCACERYRDWYRGWL